MTYKLALVNTTQKHKQKETMPKLAGSIVHLCVTKNCSYKCAFGQPTISSRVKLRKTTVQLSKRVGL